MPAEIRIACTHGCGSYVVTTVMGLRRIPSPWVCPGCEQQQRDIFTEHLQSLHTRTLNPRGHDTNGKH